MRERLTNKDDRDSAPAGKSPAPEGDPEKSNRDVPGSPHAAALLALQRSVGNAATATYLRGANTRNSLHTTTAAPGVSPRGPSRAPSVQRSTGNRVSAGGRGGGRITVQRDDVDDAQTGLGAFDTVTSGLTTGTSIGTAAYQQTNASGTSQNLATGWAGVGAGIVGLTSVAEMGLSAKQHHEALKSLKQVKGQAGKEHLERARERTVATTGGDVASNTLNATSNVSSIVTGGIGIAGTIGTVASSVGNAAGVAGSVIAMPVQIFTLVRQSYRAELQRQRMERVEELSSAKSLGSTRLDTEAELTAKTGARDLAKQQATDAQAELNTAKEEGRRLAAAKLKAENKVERLTQLEATTRESLEQAKDAYAKARTKKTVPLSQLGEQMRAILGIEDTLAQISKDRTKAGQTVAALARQITENGNDVTTLEQDLQAKTSDASVKEKDADRVEKMKALTETSGHLKDTGDKETAMPSLQEIADYAVRKNRRGWSRRAIGATAAGIGVAAGAIGIASAVEFFKGNNQMAGDLGIAGAVVGGAAALMGIGVGIWKLASWARKRKAQAKKIAQQPGASKPTFAETYAIRGRKKVDQSTKRRHYATALLTYATHGTAKEREEANDVMARLDPKGPWAKNDQNGKPVGLDEALSDTDRSELVDHFMAKMASGG